MCTSSLVADEVPILQACSEVFGPPFVAKGSKYCNKSSKYLDRYFEVYEPCRVPNFGGVQILRERSFTSATYSIWQPTTFTDTSGEISLLSCLRGPVAS